MLLEVVGGYPIVRNKHPPHLKKTLFSPAFVYFGEMEVKPEKEVEKRHVKLRVYLAKEDTTDKKRIS